MKSKQKKRGCGCEILIFICSSRMYAALYGALWEQPATQSWMGLWMEQVVGRTK